MARRKGVLDKTWQQFSDANLRKERIYYRKFDEVESDNLVAKQMVDPKRVRKSPRIGDIEGGRDPKTRSVTSFPSQTNSPSKQPDYLGPRVSLKSNNIGTGNKKSDARIERPKSARPETRHGRHARADTEMEGNNQRDMVPRPKSARPESRHTRLIEDSDSVNRLVLDSEDSDLDYNPDIDGDLGSDLDSDLDLDINNEGIGTGRPKSRRGYRNLGTIGQVSNQRENSHSDVHVSETRIKDTNKPARKGILKNSSESPRYPDNETGSQQVKDEVFGSALDNLNSGLHDIDLDLDPVLYFLHGDDYAANSHSHKPVLSQETISAIGKTKTPLKTKPPTGYHGNNQNKSKPNMENDGRFHRNRSSSVHNSLPGSNQISNPIKRRARIKSDVTTYNKDSFAPHRAGAVDRQQVPVMPGNIVRRYDSYGNYNQGDSGAHVAMKSHKRLDALIDGTHSRYRYSENCLDRGEEYGMRKPRKLQPITASISSKH